MPTETVQQRKALKNGAALPPISRNFTLQRAADDENPLNPGTGVKGLDIEARTLELTFSSELPVARWFGNEVLSHEPGCADLTRLNDGGPLLWGHNTYDMAALIGVVEKAWIDADKRGHAIVRFAKSESGDQAMSLVAQGVLRNVSFMYRVDKFVIESDEEDPYYDDDAVYRAVKWSCMEISLLSVPADQSIGVGRSAPEEAREVTVEVRSARPAHPPPAAARATDNQPSQISATQEDQDDMKFRRTPVCQAADTVTSTGTAPAPAAVDPVQQERKRFEDLTALGRRHNIGMDKVHDMIARGIDLAAARGEILEMQLAGGQSPVASLGSGMQPDMTDKEKRAYSYLRALQAMATNNWDKAGFEREVSQDIGKRMGKEASASGFFFPNDLPFAPTVEHQRAYEMLSTQGKTQLRATYNVGTAGQGGNLVATNLMSESFIEVLRNQIVTAILGARYLTGLTGNVDIPRQASQTATNWVGEGGGATQAEATFDKVQLRPKTITALSRMTRLMLLQSTPAIEMLARLDLVSVLALAIDLAAISGSGSGNTPTGIVNQAGVASVIGGTNGANLTFDHLIQLKYATKFANAPQSSAGFAMNSKAIGYLSTQKSTTGQYLWDPQGGLVAGSPDRVKGSPYAESQQLRSNLTKGTSVGICSETVYGNWQELFIAQWGVTELMLNPYDQTGFANGDVLLRALQTCDTGVRHGASFSVMSDALTPGF
jgi:HK97 family phage major capsid protein